MSRCFISFPNTWTNVVLCIRGLILDSLSAFKTKECNGVKDVAALNSKTTRWSTSVVHISNKEYNYCLVDLTTCPISFGPLVRSAGPDYVSLFSCNMSQLYSGQEVQNTSVRGSKCERKKKKKRQMQTSHKKGKNGVINLPQKLNWLSRCGKTKYEVGGRRRQHEC